MENEIKQTIETRAKYRLRFQRVQGGRAFIQKRHIFIGTENDLLSLQGDIGLQGENKILRIIPIYMNHQEEGGGYARLNPDVKIIDDGQGSKYCSLVVPGKSIILSTCGGSGMFGNTLVREVPGKGWCVYINQIFSRTWNQYKLIAENIQVEPSGAALSEIVVNYIWNNTHVLLTESSVQRSDMVSYLNTLGEYDRLPLVENNVYTWIEPMDSILTTYFTPPDPGVSMLNGLVILSNE